MYVEGQAVLAFCYIGKNGDEKNICYLTKDNLLIKYKNRLESFDHEAIHGISFEHKMLLFPLVLGGIITPLSIHGLLNTYINPWLLLISMVTGLFLMYYGWEGSSSMTIKTKVKDYDFFIRQVSTNLKAFAGYVQHYISDDVNARRFYFITDKAGWENSKGNELFKATKPVDLYNWEEIRQVKVPAGNVILAVDPTESDVQISFIQSSDKKKLQPQIANSFPVADIHEVTVWN
ncbi:hypothetical protein GCM10009122_28550 [Fulvivirga kasyanovii]|uniref:Uncharacterized protein n=1 Tax=Fulvivirga kasyanovii TaxID=396812 RepID=A0ABW9RIJ7_9BACT|nr:hypothetical protein [Fulvivirga kasyanovii]MTI23882.1 hypothetical protein [Fulvivirga kasyanovii]